jgi:hypothetical protein
MNVKCPAPRMAQPLGFSEVGLIAPQSSLGCVKND